MCMLTDFHVGDIVAFAPETGCRAQGVFWGRVLGVGRHFLTVHQYGAGVTARMDPDEIEGIVTASTVPNGPTMMVEYLT